MSLFAGLLIAAIWVGFFMYCAADTGRAVKRARFEAECLTEFAPVAQNRRAPVLTGVEAEVASVPGLNPPARSPSTHRPGVQRGIGGWPPYAQAGGDGREFPISHTRLYDQETDRG